MWPLHPATLRAGTCHSWPRALPNTSEKSHEFVGAGNRGKAGAQSYSDFGAYGVRIEFRKSSWMCAPSQRATHLFLPPSLCIWPSIPMSDDTTSRTFTPENQPPSQDLETLHFYFGQKVHFYRLSVKCGRMLRFQLCYFVLCQSYISVLFFKSNVYLHDLPWWLRW